jgi:hypothetical protein
MIKVLHKIMLLVAVTTVIGHSILPHIHHDEEFVVISDQHHHESPAGKHHHDDENDSDKRHEVFSLAQLDDNYIPAKKLYSTFGVPVEFAPLFTVILIVNSKVATKTDFGWYKEYPPPDNPIRTLSFRGPPAA